MDPPSVDNSGSGKIEMRKTKLEDLSRHQVRGAPRIGLAAFFGADHAVVAAQQLFRLEKARG